MPTLTVTEANVAHRFFDDAAQDYDRVASFMAFGSGGWYRRCALGRAGLVHRALGALFALDAACDKLPWGPGLVLVARRAALTTACASAYPGGEATRLGGVALEAGS